VAAPLSFAALAIGVIGIFATSASADILCAHPVLHRPGHVPRLPRCVPNERVHAPTGSYVSVPLDSFYNYCEKSTGGDQCIRQCLTCYTAKKDADTYTDGTCTKKSGKLPADYYVFAEDACVP